MYTRIHFDVSSIQKMGRSIQYLKLSIAKQFSFRYFIPFDAIYSYFIFIMDHFLVFLLLQKNCYLEHIPSRQCDPLFVNVKGLLSLRELMFVLHLFFCLHLLL